MKDCIFCKIVNQELPSKKVYEDEEILAFEDIQPSAPVHILIIPKKHIASMESVEGGDWDLIAKVHQVAQLLAREKGVSESGYRLVNNCGPDGGQLVAHIHYHLLAGKSLGPLVQLK